MVWLTLQEVPVCPKAVLPLRGVPALMILLRWSGTAARSTCLRAVLLLPSCPVLISGKELGTRNSNGTRW
jgi:hypothetical protein